MLSMIGAVPVLSGIRAVPPVVRGIGAMLPVLRGIGAVPVLSVIGAVPPVLKGMGAVPVLGGTEGAVPDGVPVGDGKLPFMYVDVSLPVIIGAVPVEAVPSGTL